MEHLNSAAAGVSPSTMTPVAGGPPNAYNIDLSSIGQAYSDVLGRGPSPTEIAYWEPEGLAYVDNTLVIDQFELIIRDNIAYSQEASNDIGSFFQAVLNRPPAAGDISPIQAVLANGSLTLAGYRASVADSPEAANDINVICQQVLNRPAAAGDDSYARMQFLGGANQAQLRADWAAGPEALADIGAIYQQVLNRAPVAAEVSWAQAVLDEGFTQAVIRTDLSNSPEAADDVTAIFEQVLDRAPAAANVSSGESWLGSGGTQQSLRTAWSQTPEVQADINQLYLVTLGRAVDPAGLAWNEGSLAGGANQGNIRLALAQSSESDADIDAIWAQVLNRQPSAGELSATAYAIGTTEAQAQARTAVAYSGEAQADITAIFERVFNRAPAAVNVGSGENWLAVGGTQQTLATVWSQSAEVQADINALYEVTLGRPADPAGLAGNEALLAAGWNQAQVRVNLAAGPEEAADVAALFAALLGRAPSADETLGVQTAIGVGYPGDPMFTLSGMVNGAAQTFATADAATDLSELAVYVTSNSGVTPTLTDMYGTPTTFADATQLAGYLLGQAIQSGTATPVLLSTYALTVSWLAQVDQPELQAGEMELRAARAAQAGGNAALAQADEVFAQAELDTAAVAPAQRTSAALSSAMFFAQAAEKAVASNIPVYEAFDESAARTWLAVVTGLATDPAGSRLLTAATEFVANGQSALVQGLVDGVMICTAGADLCLQEAAEPVGARTLGVERIYESGGVTVDVGVDPAAADPYGSSTIHSKDQDGGITGLLVPLLTAVLDIAAVVTGNEWALALASVVDVGESAQNFAEGNVLAGVLDLGAAAGFGAESVGAFAQSEGVAAGAQGVALAGYPTILSGTAAATSLTGQYILEATALVGGLSGIVNSAENGNGLGIVAASLETAAAIAGGLASTGAAGSDAALAARLAVSLGIAGGVTAGVNAIEHGDVANGLLETLGPLIQAVASAVALSPDTYAPSNIVNPSSVPTVLIGNRTVLFVGGFFDQLGATLLGLPSPVHDAYTQFVAKNPSVPAQYFSWDQGNALAKEIDADSGNVIVYAHSYGASTAASVVASGHPVNTLITLDPVGLFNPSYQSIHDNAANWIDINASGGSYYELSNLIAGGGGAWNGGPQGIANTFFNVTSSHGSIATDFYSQSGYRILK